MSLSDFKYNFFVVFGMHTGLFLILIVFQYFWLIWLSGVLTWLSTKKTSGLMFKAKPFSWFNLILYMNLTTIQFLIMMLTNHNWKILLGFFFNNHSFTM